MASIGRGLETGINLGFKIDEALRRKQMRDEIEAARKEKEFGRYSQERADKLQALSKETDFPDMLDEKGDPLKPKYKFTIKPGSTEYDVIPLTYSEAPPAAAGDQDYTRQREDLAYRIDMARRGLERTIPRDAPVNQVLNIPELNPEERRRREVELDNLTQQYRALLSRTAEDQPAGITKQGGPSVGVPTGDAITYSPDVIEYLGKTYAQGLTPGKLSDKQKNAALMDKYAEIISGYDPIEGLKFKAAADKERREQEAFDINKALTEFKYKELQRGAKQDEAEDKFFEAVQNGEVDFNTDWNKLSKDFGIRPKRLNEIAEGVLKLESGQITRMQTAVDKAMIKSQGNLDKFLQLSLDDKDYDPTSHLVKRAGPNGGIIIDTVETVDNEAGGKTAGRVISSTQELPNAVEAMEFMYNTLRNPSVAAQTALKNQQLRADIAEKEATAQYKLSAADFYSRRDTGAGGLGRGGNLQFAGFDSDGSPISYSPKDGKLSRYDGQPIQDPTFIKKFTGEQTKSVKEQWAEINIKLLKDGQPPNYIARAKAAFFEENGYAPDEAINALRSGKNPYTGKPLTQADIDAFRQTYPNTDISKFMPKPDGQKGLGKTDTVTNESAEPKTPVEDKKKYIRSKNPRGGWVYEESPRGLTKAQYAEIDAKR
jgi:hypothetical protein